MDQGGGLEGLARSLPRELLGGELAQLLVHSRQQLVDRPAIALLDGIQDLGDIVNGHLSTPIPLKSLCL